jgi:prevent-host-death family protein
MLVSMTKRAKTPPIVSLYDAKTHLSSLVERAADGEEIVIAKNGAPRARLVGIPRSGARRRPAGAMKITYIAEDFDARDEQIEALFAGDG